MDIGTMHLIEAANRGDRLAAVLARWSERTHEALSYEVRHTLRHLNGGQIAHVILRLAARGIHECSSAADMEAALRNGVLARALADPDEFPCNPDATMLALRAHWCAPSTSEVA